MHAVALAISEILAFGTVARTHPFAIAIGVELVFPHLHEVVFVDVPLMIVGADAGAGRDGAVYQHGTHCDACLTSVEMVAHFTLVVAKEALAAIIQTDASFASGGSDELRHASEIVVGEVQFGVGGGASHGHDGGYPPAFQTDVYEEFLQFLQPGKAVLVHAGHHIEHQSGGVGHHSDGVHGAVEAVRIASHPVVVGGKSVEADGGGMQSGCHEGIQPFAGEEESVGLIPHGNPRS